MNYFAAFVGGSISMTLAWLIELPTDWRMIALISFCYAWGRLIMPLFDRPSNVPTHR